ncbi:MAG: outer membrane protein assembly factor BamB [Chlamydiales bacterium]|jgi:outer membrane protein assembly factor BamB
MQRPTHLAAIALLALPALSGTALAYSEGVDKSGSWPQWRGPTRDGQAPGVAWGPDLEAERLGEAWRIDGLGPSYSGPVVDSERVYTTETVDEEREVVRALNRTDGKEIWRVSWTGSMEVPFFAAQNGSWIRSTPAVDKDSLYVAGIRDVLMCLDARTGEKRWSVDFGERFDCPLPPFGCVSSPLLAGEHVYIQAGASLVKLDKANGETVWRSMVEDGEVMSGGAFSSPVLAELQGQLQLVIQSRTDLVGVSMEDGQTLWSTPVKAYRGMNILTPTIFGDGVFTSTYGGRSQLFTIDQGEDGCAVKSQWNSPVQGYMTSPVVVDGHAYLFLKSNRFGCIDLETGESRWTSPPTGDSYWSLAARDGLILALSDFGTLRLIRADPAGYEVISEREVADDDTWAHIAPAGDQVFFRSQGSLIALDWK